MCDLQTSGHTQRRPSFWKTPIPRDSALQTLGQKRNYSEITHDAEAIANDSASGSNPKKKRRLLTESEIANIAKCGGFNPSNIIIAVEEQDGFCWFKTKQNNPSFDKQEYLKKYWNITKKEEDESTVLRELSKDELKERKEANKVNPNQLNKQKAMERAAKLRRHTAPIQALQALMERNDKKQKELMPDPQNIEPKKKRKRRKVKKKKTKKIISYKTKKEIIRKKVKKTKRILKKKKSLSQKIKITTEFAPIDIPDFPVPNLKFSVLFHSATNSPFLAIEQFELSLIESFVIPLTSVYGKNDELAFIARNVLQNLMEIKNNIHSIVNCIEFEVIKVSQHKNNKKIIQKMPQNNDLKELNEEYIFYENQSSLIDSFCDSIEEEIDFTKHAQEQLEDEEYLQQIFDFDFNDQQQQKQQNNNNYLIVDDEDFVNKIGSEIDAIYTEYALHFKQIQYEQHRYEHTLNQIELKHSQITTQYFQTRQARTNRQGEDNETYDKLEELVQTEKKKTSKLETLRAMTQNIVDPTKDKFIFANCIKANTKNDASEDDNIAYLRQLDGYQMEHDDTMRMDVDCQ